MKEQTVILPPQNLHWEQKGDIYQFAADYPGVMVMTAGALLIILWFFIRKKM